MALQLIDLGNEVEVVEIDTSKVPYTFSVKLTDKTYTFTVKYNEAGSFFTVDLATSDGEPLVYGDIVRYGRPLFGSVEDERFPLPVIIPQCLTGEDIDTAPPSARTSITTGSRPSFTPFPECSTLSSRPARTAPHTATSTSPSTPARKPSPTRGR